MKIQFFLKRAILSGAKPILSSEFLQLAVLSSVFPLFAFISNLNPRNDSLNKFDNLIFFARNLRIENELPIWTTLNFGNFSSLENLGVRPEEMLAILLHRLLSIDSISILVYFVIYSAVLAMNVCFVSLCKNLGINSRRLVFALILILDFAAFPFTQYWLHFLVIFNTVLILRVYLSIGMNPLRRQFLLAIPIAYAIWGGYALILPAIALSPILPLSVYLGRKGMWTPLRTLRRRVWGVLLIVAFIGISLFAFFAYLFLTESRVSVTGRSSSGTATLESYLSPAGRGTNKFFELLGAPTIWQDTHLVISPLLVPFLVSFMIVRFHGLPKVLKVKFMTLLLTVLWTIMLTIPMPSISSFLYTSFPFLKLSRNPGFQMGILIPLLLLIMGVVFSSSHFQDSNTNTYKNTSKKSSRVTITSSPRKSALLISNRQEIKMHLYGWLIVLMLYLLNFLPYPLQWVRILLGHLLYPATLVLLIVMAALLIPESRKGMISNKKRQNLFSSKNIPAFTKALISLSSIIVFSLGIFQMYFLSFVDYKNVQEMSSNLTKNFQDNNFVQRAIIRTELGGKVTNWAALTKQEQESLITQTRLSRMGYANDTPWMKLIDSNPAAKVRTQPFEEFTSKTFFDEVLHEATPSNVMDPNTSRRASLRRSENFTTNLVSSSAYSLNEDYCPALGMVQSVSRNLSDRVLTNLNRPHSDLTEVCSGNKVLFLDELGISSEAKVLQSSLKVANGEAKLDFTIDDSLLGKTVQIIYRDSYSKHWRVKVNGTIYPLRMSADGYKLLSIKIQRKSNLVEFYLPSTLKYIANSRLFVDPLIYLGFVWFCAYSFRRPNKVT